MFRKGPLKPEQMTVFSLTIFRSGGLRSSSQDRDVTDEIWLSLKCKVREESANEYRAKPAVNCVDAEERRHSQVDAGVDPQEQDTLQ